MLLLLMGAFIAFIAGTVQAAHAQVHEYSIARENGHSYTGGETYRYDAIVDCNGNGDALYQPLWLIWDSNNWVEVGTGHCWDRGTEWYWGQSVDGNWTWEGFQDADAGETHRFTLVEGNTRDTCWYDVFIDGSAIDSLTAPEGCTESNRADVGLETYNSDAVTTVDSSALEEQHDLGGSWHAWANTDDEHVDDPLMDGCWLEVDEWRASINEQSC